VLNRVMTLTAAALAVLAEPIIAVLFERGAFGPAAVTATALTLAAYAIGLPAHVQVKVLATAFFAREDTATPVKVGAVALLVNLGFNLALMGPLGHVGIALATSIAAWVNAGLLAWLLLRRGRFLPDARLKRKLPRIALASAVMAGAVAGVVYAYPEAIGWHESLRFGFVVAVVAGGGILYAALALIGGAVTFGELRTAMRRPGPASPTGSSSPG